jgi:large subunit ribosomal protein L21
MYAVIEIVGKQYRVVPGTILEVDRLEAEAGKTVTVDRVLLISNDGKLNLGNPTVSKASVVVDVIEHLRGEKKIAFKMKRRKGYHRTVGHRQELTRIKVAEIKL